MKKTTRKLCKLNSSLSHLLIGATLKILSDSSFARWDIEYRLSIVVQIAGQFLSCRHRVCYAGLYCNWYFLFLRFLALPSRRRSPCWIFLSRWWFQGRLDPLSIASCRRAHFSSFWGKRTHMHTNQTHTHEHTQSHKTIDFCPLCIPAEVYERPRCYIENYRYPCSSFRRW